MKRMLQCFLLLLLLAAGCDTANKTPRRTSRVQLTEDRQRRADALFLEAQRQKHKRNFDAMQELLTAALDIHPDMSEALCELAALRMPLPGETDSVQAEKCISMMERATALEPDNKFYQKMLAGFYVRSERYADAINIYEKLARTNPEPEQLQYLVSLYEGTGDFDKALATLERLEQLDGKSEEYTMAKCRIYNQTGETHNMLTTMEALCEEYPGDLRYRVMLGEIYLMCGLDTAALDIYDEVLTLEPENSFAQLSMLNYCRQQENLLTVEEYNRSRGDKADSSALTGNEADWVRRIMLNPSAQSSAKEGVMRSYIERMKPDTATVSELFQRTLSMPQTDARIARLYLSYIFTFKLSEDHYELPLRLIIDLETETLEERSMLLPVILQREDWAEAEKFCRESRTLFPDEVLFYYYEGMAAYQQNKTDEALDAFRKGTEVTGKSTDLELASSIYASMGDILHDKGAKEEAYAAYDTALTYQSDNYLCMNNYAYFLALDGERLDFAETLSHKAVEANSEDPVYLDTHAWVLYRKELFTQARIYIDRALRNIEETPDKAGYFDHAGDIYYMCGEKQSAVDYWKTALRLSDDAELSAQLREKIRRKRGLP